MVFYSQGARLKGVGSVVVAVAVAVAAALVESRQRLAPQILAAIPPPSISVSHSPASSWTAYSKNNCSVVKFQAISLVQHGHGSSNL